MWSPFAENMPKLWEGGVISLRKQRVSSGANYFLLSNKALANGHLSLSSCPSRTSSATSLLRFPAGLHTQAAVLLQHPFEVTAERSFSSQKKKESEADTIALCVSKNAV